MKKIVVVGGGVGGFEFVICLSKIFGKKKLVEVILVDCSCIYVWKFLLYEVVVGIINKVLDGVDYCMYVV